MRRPWIYASALLLYVFALLSKTVTCLLPVVILIVLWWKKGKIESKDIFLTGPLFLAGLGMGMLTVWMEIHQVGASGSEWHNTLIERVLIAGRALWFYLGKLVFPRELIFTYPRWRIHSGLWQQYLYPVSFAALLAGLWKMSARWGRGVLAAVLYFCVVLFPALGFFNLFPMRFSYVADHFQYLASIGPTALVAALLCRLWERSASDFKKILTAVFLTALFGLCWKTWTQTHVYKDQMTLFSDVIQKNPSSWMAYNNRGHVLFSLGQVDPAEKDFMRALELYPNFADAHNNLGMICAMRGQNDQAMDHFNRALQLNDRYFAAYGNRGGVYRNKGEFKKAKADFNRALEINPGYVEGYNRRAVLFSIQGDHDKALKDFNTLLKIDPGFAAGYVNRALVLMKGKNYQSALNDLDRALSINPHMAAAYSNRAEILEHLGEWESALADFSRAAVLGLDIDPQRIRDLKIRIGK